MSSAQVSSRISIKKYARPLTTSKKMAVFVGNAEWRLVAAKGLAFKDAVGRNTTFWRDDCEVNDLTWLRTCDVDLSMRFGSDARDRKARFAGPSELRSVCAVNSSPLVCTVLLHRRGIIVVSVADKAAAAKATETKGTYTRGGSEGPIRARAKQLPFTGRGLLVYLATHDALHLRPRRTSGCTTDHHVGL